MIWKQKKKEKDNILLILQTEGLTRGSLYFGTHKKTWKYQLPGWYKIKKLKKKKKTRTNKQLKTQTKKLTQKAIKYVNDQVRYRIETTLVLRNNEFPYNASRCVLLTIK